jgi:hypothetical protein
MATCSSCHAPIIWTVTTKGKPMPVNADPDPLNGNVEVSPPARGARLPTAHVHRQRPLNAEHPLHLPHFATCPYADQHRKKRERRR